MTEQEWLECAEPGPMLAFLRTNFADRKLRLFGTACVRRIWHLLSEEASKHFLQAAADYTESLTVAGDVFFASRQVVEVVERYGEGAAKPQELAAAHGTACEVAWNANDFIGIDALQTWAACAAAATAALDVDHIDRPCEPGSPDYSFDVPQKCAAAIAKAGKHVQAEDRHLASDETESAAQAALVRDIFGNPFRPVTIEPAWRMPTVTSLAQAIYDERAFDRMPVLGDALEDAGCTHADVLQHCRQPAEHVRGCWLVDALLGKD